MTADTVAAVAMISSTSGERADAPDHRPDTESDVESDVDSPVSSDLPPEPGHDLPDTPARTMWTRTDWKICGVLLVASLLLVGLHVRSYETLSPIDELQHIDYMIGAGNFDIPRTNERVGPEAMAEAACRSVDAPGYVGPPCGLESYDPNDFQENGFNTATTQFPPYYLVTGVTARFLTAVGIFDSKVTAARMIGGLWLAAALAVTWYLMACLGVSRRSRAPVIALLLFTPLTIFHAGATVNADVSLMLTGVAVVLATVKYEAGRLRWPWLPLIYLCVMFVEPTNILAVTACALYLMVRRIPDTSLPMVSRLAPAAILPALLIFRLEVSERVHSALFPAAPIEQGAASVTSAPMFSSDLADGVSFEKVLAQLNATFTPVRNPYLSPPLRSQLTIAGLEITNWVLIALLLAAAVAVGSRLTWWARVTVLMLLAAGPFYTFYFAHFAGHDYAAPARFALPLVPLMATVAAGAIKRPQVSFAVYGVAALTGLNTLFQLLTA